MKQKIIRVLSGILLALLLVEAGTRFAGFVILSCRDTLSSTLR